MDEYTKEFHIAAVRTAVRTGTKACVLIGAPFGEEDLHIAGSVPVIASSAGSFDGQTDGIKGKKTVFCLCSVTPATDLAAFNNLLGRIASSASDGSSLVLDYDDGNAYAATKGAEKDMLVTAEALELMLSLQGFVIYEYIASDGTHPCLVHAVYKK